LNGKIYLTQIKLMPIAEFKMNDGKVLSVFCIISFKDTCTAKEGKSAVLTELMKYLRRPRVRTIYIGKSGAGGTDLCAFASARRVDRRDLLFEFGDTGITNHIRSTASGSIASIVAIAAIRFSPPDIL
jgi:hypothetical protein